MIHLNIYLLQLWFTEERYLHKDFSWRSCSLNIFRSAFSDLGVCVTCRFKEDHFPVPWNDQKSPWLPEKGGRSQLAARMALAQKYLINGNLCARKLCKVRPEFQSKAAAIKATPIAATAGWYEEVPSIRTPRRF